MCLTSGNQNTRGKNLLAREQRPQVSHDLFGVDAVHGIAEINRLHADPGAGEATIAKVLFNNIRPAREPFDYVPDNGLAIDLSYLRHLPSLLLFCTGLCSLTRFRLLAMLFNCTRYVPGQP